MTDIISPLPTVILTGNAPTTKWTMSSRKPEETSSAEEPLSAQLILFSEAPQTLTYVATAVNTLRWWAPEEQIESLERAQCSNMTDYMLNHGRVWKSRPVLRLAGSGIAPGRVESAEYEGTLKICDDFTLRSSLPPEIVEKLIADDAMKDLNSMEFEVTPHNMIPYYVSKTSSEHPAPSLNNPRTLQIHGSTLGTAGNATLKMFHDRTDFEFETTPDTEEETAALKDREAYEAATRKLLEDAWGSEARPMKIHSSFVGHLLDQGVYSEAGNPEYFVTTCNPEEARVGDDGQETVSGE